MNPSIALLLLGSLSLCATCCVLVRARSIGALMIPYFFIAWLTAELAVYHLLWQGLLALYLISCGALGSAAGVIGLLLLLLSFAGLVRSLRLSAQAEPVLDEALDNALGPAYREQIEPARQRQLRDEVNWREWMRPFSFRREGVKVVRSIPYGPAGARNRLDIYQPQHLPAEGCPVLLQVHGGAWIIGNKQQQALPLMYHMAQRGWLCVSINYRLSPESAFPAHIEDVKLALGWIKQHIDDYGGNPAYVAITGGSAGGHLCALAALTPNQARFQPGFEHMDTSVQAAVPIYGVYDWLDESGCGGIGTLQTLLTRLVMKCTPQSNQALWREGRPLAQVCPQAPPMMMVQGSHDSLVAVEDARYFVQALRAVSNSAVVYAELPGAQHAFDIFHSLRCDATVNGVAQFLEWSYGRWRRQQVAPD